MLPDKIDSGEEKKNRFSRWPPWWPSWISNLNDFSCFDLQVTLMLHTKLQVSWPFSSGEHGGHLAFPFGMILAIFDLQVMLTTEFQVNWPFGSGEEAKNRFLKWLPWWPSWISNRNDYSYFWSASPPDASYKVWSQLAQGWRRSWLLKQIVDAAWRTTHNQHWPIKIAHLEQFVLRWAKNAWIIEYIILLKTIGPRWPCIAHLITR